MQQTVFRPMQKEKAFWNILIRSFTKALTNIQLFLASVSLHYRTAHTVLGCSRTCPRMSIVPINQGDQGRNASNSDNPSQDLWDPNALAFNLDLWDPFGDFLSDFGFGSSVNTRLDWRETPRGHVWKVVLPGFTNEDVLVELQDERVLQVSVESGNFMSRFKVPDDGNLQELKANMHNGVLVVTVPKYEQPARDGNIRVIEIDGSG